MSAWGSNFKSCSNLLTRIERNDPSLQNVIILSTKTFTEIEMNRILSVLENGTNTNLKSLSASGHKLPPKVLFHLGRVLAKTKNNNKNGAMIIEEGGLLELAFGDQTMGDEGICSFCNGILQGEEGRLTTLQILDLSWKGIGLQGFTTILQTLSQLDKNKQLHTMNLSRNPQIATNNEVTDITKESSDDVAFDDKNDNQNNNDNKNSSRMMILPYIQELDLSKCEVDGIFLKKHLFFDTSTPNVSRISSATLSSFQSLTILRLDHNPIGAIGFEAVIASVLKGRKIPQRRPPSEDDDNNIPYSSYSARCSVLEELYLSHCSIDDEAIECLCPLSDSNKNSTSTTTSYFSSLTVCRLRKLDLSCNYLTSKGIAYLAHALQGGNNDSNREEKRSKEEGKEQMDSKHASTTTSFSSPSSWVCCFPHLVDLNVAGNNNIGEKGVLKLANALIQRNANIREIIMEDKDDIYANNTNNIIAKSVQTLDVSETNCRANGAVALIGIVGLKSLRFFNNNLGKNVARSDNINLSGDTASASTNVTASSSIVNSGFDDALGGFEFIAKSLPLSSLSSSMLEILDLSGNNAEQADVTKMLRSLLLSPSSSNAITEQKYTLLPKLQLLVIGGNGGGCLEVEKAILEIKQIRPELDIARDKKKG